MRRLARSRSDRGHRWVRACGAVLAAALVLALAGAAAGGERSARVAGARAILRTTGSRSELVKTIPITRNAGGEKRVVMSMKRGTLPDLRQGDTLKVTAELQVTDDCRFDHPRCTGRPYKYNPAIEARLILARSGDVTGGAGAVSLGRPQRHVCLQELPNREHHCVLVFTHAGTDVGGGHGLPCKPEKCRVNLVLDAHNRHARGGNNLDIGGNRPDGSVPQDRGRINALVLRPGSQLKPDPEVTKRRRHSRLKLDKHRRVVYSKRLNGLKKGDQITAESLARADISHLPYNTIVASQIVVADRRTQTHAGNFARSVARGGSEMSESNGFNCTQKREPCSIRKVGTLRLAKDAENGNGHPRPLYVNLVMLGGPKRTKARPGDRLQILDNGHLEVRRYR